MTSASLNRACAVFLQAVTLLIGLGVLTFLLWQPLVEGRNVNATLLQVYFSDPFLAYAYGASLPGFVALAQIFRLLGRAGRDRLYAPASVKALRTIKICALCLIGFVALGEVFLMAASLGTSDDPAGAIAMGVIVSFGVTVVTASAALCERQVAQAVAMKASAAEVSGVI